jgi:hypothetical protein
MASTAISSTRVNPEQLSIGLFFIN